MKVVIIKGSVLHNGKNYYVGDEIKQIHKDDGSRLIKKGVAEEYVEPEKENDNSGQSADDFKTLENGSKITEDGPDSTENDSEGSDVTKDSGEDQTPSEDESKKVSNDDEVQK